VREPPMTPLTPPRVALYTDSDAFAGTERHMWDLARGLRAEGVAVSLACPSPSALEEAARPAGLPVLGVPKRGLVDWRAARALGLLLRGGQFDIVHAHNGRTALAAALAVRMAGRGRCVMTQHFLEPNHAGLRGPKAVLSRQAHRWVTRQMGAVVAISQAVRAAMLSRGEVPDSKITVIPNGIAAPDAALSAGAAATRRSLGVAPDEPLVVCTARLEPEKDVGTLVSAMTRVRTACPAVRCLLVGAGSQRPHLEEQIQSLGLTEVVQLLGFRADAQAVIAAADVFTLPSLAEPFGLVLLEAMALGKPVVAVGVGGPLEVVVEGETGLLVPPAAPDALAGALGTLLGDPALRRRFGENGLARFRQRFTGHRMAEATAGVYRAVTGPPAAKP